MNPSRLHSHSRYDLFVQVSFIVVRQPAVVPPPSAHHETLGHNTVLQTIERRRSLDRHDDGSAAQMSLYLNAVVRTICNATDCFH